MQTPKFSPGIPSLLLFALLVLVSTATTWATKHAGKDMPAERRLEATLADARPLKIHFTLKRSSMKMYDQTEFDVFANPVVSSDNSAVRYDGYANFSEGGDTKHTILLVDGVAYLITSIAGEAEATECLDSTSLTPLNYILPALNAATAISSATVGGKEITCKSGGLFKVALGDATFVLCASGSDGFIVYGTDLDITVRYLDDRVPITAPTLSDDEARSCETVVTPSQVTTTTLALLTGSPVVNTRSLAHYLGHYFTYER
ncbi:hypothetical protein PRIC1_004086 [Phytophthora ramorum]